MDKSRQGFKKIEGSSSFIVESNRVWWRELIVLLFSFLIWLYCAVVIYFFVDSVFGLNHDLPSKIRDSFGVSSFEVRWLVGFIVFLFSGIYLLLVSWSLYNKKRFGGLSRRKYPSVTTKEELLGLNLVDDETFESLQEGMFLVFDKNPVKRKVSSK